MNKDNIDQFVDKSELGLRKGVLMYAVLHVLKHGPVYSSDILMRLREAEMIVVEGTVYPLLSRLHEEGVVSYEWRESESGPPRKYYQLTDMGKAALEALEPKVMALFTTLQTLEGKKGPRS
jgi:PadR family transcriptional regulator PadR